MGNDYPICSSEPDIVPTPETIPYWPDNITDKIGFAGLIGLGYRIGLDDRHSDQENDLNVSGTPLVELTECTAGTSMVNSMDMCEYIGCISTGETGPCASGQTAYSHKDIRDSSS